MSHVAKRLAAKSRTLRVKNEFLSIEMSFNLPVIEHLHIFNINFKMYFSFFGTILRMRTNRKRREPEAVSLSMRGHQHGNLASARNRFAGYGLMPKKKKKKKCC